MIDSEAIRDYLLSFDVFAGAPQEGINYLTDALQRLLITLEMVPDKDRPGLHLLELGAGPYFFTLLLQKYTHYTLHQANFFGHDFPGPMMQTVTSTRYGEQFSFAFENFNAETEIFPYPDATFDLVTCCEIIEHLTVDPTHMLCEIHRVLKPGGALLLTTPNVFRLAHVLALLQGQHNIFHPYPTLVMACMAAINANMGWASYSISSRAVATKSSRRAGMTSCPVPECRSKLWPG